MCGCGNCCYFESLFITVILFITVYYIPRKPGTRPGDFFLCPKKETGACYASYRTPKIPVFRGSCPWS